MPRRWYQKFITTEILAIGIEGDCSSLCGALKRFQRHGIQSNGLLSLKEQCARHIARIKNEQIKWFITAYLPPNLFQYVTKDIFNLQRDEFTSNYADDFDLCDACSTNTGEVQRTKYRCPKVESAIDKLNKYFFKRMNNGNKIKDHQSKQFELIYKLPDCEDDYSDYNDEPPLFFLYLLPYANKTFIDPEDLDDEGRIPYQSCKLIDQVSVEDKLLFVDVMRFFGGFESKHEQPKVILYYCNEHKL